MAYDPNERVSGWQAFRTIIFYGLCFATILYVLYMVAVVFG